MARKKKIEIIKPERSDLSVGQRVQLNLSYHIAANQDVSESLLDLWKEINGGFGVITKIESDEEIWVVGEITEQERMFTAYTLVKV